MAASKTFPDAILERLCGHLQTELFQPAPEYEFLKADLDGYRRDFSDADETIVFVLLAESSKVVGFIAVKDLHVPETDKLYLSIPATALAAGWTGGNPGFRLIAKALDIAHVRNEAHFHATGVRRYEGVACVPWTDEIRDVLERHHFIQLKQMPFWWIRPFKRGKRP